MKRLIVFDLDGTLADSKAPLDAEMAQLLTHLLTRIRVAIISGGGWPQFEKQVLAQLGAGEQLSRLSLLPTCGTKFFRFEGTWQLLYSEDFTTAQKDKITAALHQATAGLTIDHLWGAQLEDRGSQITFSALGQQAPLDAKAHWDPTFAKRQAITRILTPLLPDFSIHLGGATSIDITQPGIDKGYGIRKLHEVHGISPAEMVFVGDALFPGGNDYPAKQAGAESICVRDPHESKRVIEAMIACLGDG